jgi:hypothetical protein
VSRRIHTQDELEAMFEAFGLGSEEERRRIRRLAREDEGTAQQADGYELRLSNSSAGFTVGRDHGGIRTSL